MPARLREFLLCERLGWTWSELQKQPKQIVEEFSELAGVVDKMRRKHHG